MLRTRASAAMLTLFCFAVPAAAAPLRAAYPKPQTEFEQGFVDLLKLALSRAGGYAPQEWLVHMEKGRAIHELVHGNQLDVVWAVANREREQQMLPVRIPLDKGISGWRLLLVNKGDAAKFGAVRALPDLARWTAGQGQDWADTAVLRANGLPVVTGNNSKGLFSMLIAGRFDYFPRSARQIWAEAEQYQARGLAVEDSLVLHYPAAVYFFVNRNNAALAAALERGLLAAIDDGSFDRLFHATHGEALRRAQFGKRRIFHLNNPDLSPETPLARKQFWYTPDTEARPMRRQP
ncbi:transporter substrate-binding domain-containing protein [Pseudoduganella ginsengisoli]|uniref:Transporter substrate-binding domain-containing protein n=1 Tax=Pseudoduganella ginsengisoli TaxID=1462440 RepID=A0A6L6Q766_9BURK|nr:hypothetical protein [Pseudoduganella ginsengisoli]MTW05683.1 hypothetical protein [Pseudoduganella ginsengisoli]